ncbi:hypothetical protein [Rhodopirellula halodulae]|uniref:hypothetical protein n=1 Tax=Rhodopirellula halodulae TaxID=2894198 RepID=UPI001E308603|nr:hypothetical protein [Rhodopirellula sp. JC737]MCC9654921.1 hypothetical protein [Rhodopirellula sp. JC737]
MPSRILGESGYGMAGSMLIRSLDDFSYGYWFVRILDESNDGMHVSNSVMGDPL